MPLTVAARDDDVRDVLLLVLEEVGKNGLRARRIAVLRVERRARVVRHHAVTRTQRVLHRAPDVVTLASDRHQIFKG